MRGGGTSGYLPVVWLLFVACGESGDGATREQPHGAGAGGTLAGSGGTAGRAGFAGESGATAAGSGGDGAGRGGGAGTEHGGASPGGASPGGAPAGGATSGNAGMGQAGTGERPLGTWLDLGLADGNRGGDDVLVKLRDGSVLFLGELEGFRRFIPETNTFEEVAPFPDGRRTEFAATLLDAGHVLVVGGNVDGSRDGSATVLDYDPEDDSWSSAADQPAARYGQAAITLPDGTVLVAGGLSAGVGGLSAADVFRYDPAADQWETLAPLPQTSRYPALFLLDASSLLVADEIPQVYDFSAQAVTRSPGHAVFRRSAANVQLPSASVLTIGGIDPFSDNEVFSVVDEYAPGATTWTARGELTLPRYLHVAVTLSDGTVLVVGGASSYEPLAEDPAELSAERYVPSLDRWFTETPPPLFTGVAGVLLDDGSVLFQSEPARFYPEPWQ